MQATIAWLNRQPLPVLIFAMLMLHYAGFELSDNEENYLQLAMQFVWPEWIPNSIALTEFAGTRVIYQYLAGYMILAFDFEWTAFLGRTLLSIGFAFSLAHFAKSLHISNFFFLVLLQGYLLTPQSLFAGEWYFLDFEAKVMAYVLVFAGLGQLFRQKHLSAFIWLALATNLHILAGGWVFLASAGYLLFQKEWKALFKGAVVYGLLCLPLVGYLAYHVLITPPAVSDAGVSADWIYVYYRNSHHIGIGKSLEYFVKKHVWGVVIAALFLGIALWGRKKLQDAPQRQANLLLMIALSIPLAFVIVSFIDAEGKLMKFYPFRLAALALFLSFVQVAMLLRTWVEGKGLRFAGRVYPVLLAFLAISLCVKSYKHWQKEWVYAQTWHNNDFNQMARFVATNTPQDAVFFYTHFDTKRILKDGHIAFNRQTRRDTFVVAKFVPAGTSKIFEWYARMLEKEKALKDLPYLFELKQRYKIDYYVADAPFEHPRAEKVYANATYHVYLLK